MSAFRGQVGVGLLFATAVALGSSAAMADDPNTVVRIHFHDDADQAKRTVTAEDMQAPNSARNGDLVYGELVGDVANFNSPNPTRELYTGKNTKAELMKCPPTATQGAICFKATWAPSTSFAPEVREKATTNEQPSGVKDPHTQPERGGSANPPPDSSSHEARLRAAYNEAIGNAIRVKHPNREDKDAPADLPFCTKPNVQCPTANAYSRGENVAVVMFNEKGEALFPIPQVDEDDTIIVVVVPDEASTVLTEVRVTACEAAVPLRIGPSGASPKEVIPASPGQKPPPHKIIIAKGCAQESGLKAVVGVKEGTGTKDITVKTLGLTRITVGLGLVYDFSVAREYRADTAKGESVPVIVKDEHMRGLVPPIPFVMLRPVPVAAERSRRLAEMWGIGAGFSLTAPLDHLYLSVLFEPYPGLGLVGGYHLHREPTLAGGYAEGDRVPGGEIKTDKRWEARPRDFFAGLNVDASVFSRVLGLIVPK